MLPPNLEELKSEHIQSLIGSEAPEALTLEFRREN